MISLRGVISLDAAESASVILPPSTPYLNSPHPTFLSSFFSSITEDVTIRTVVFARVAPSPRPLLPWNDHKLVLTFSEQMLWGDSPSPRVAPFSRCLMTRWHQHCNSISGTAFGLVRLCRVVNSECPHVRTGLLDAGLFCLLVTCLDSC